MAKYYGNVGFAETTEVRPGVWVDTITERPYYGDLIRNFGKNQPSGGVNNNINIANSISIVSDPYANQNFLKIKYLEFMGVNWCVTDVEVNYPRLILTIGGVYNGEPSEITNNAWDFIR